jgi:hypothetical protein
LPTSDRAFARFDPPLTIFDRDVVKLDRFQANLDQYLPASGRHRT